MLKADLNLLASNLNALAEALDRKPLSGKALEVWFDCLREFPTEQVMGLLIGWPKQHTKFPAPADVWKVANDLGTAERERKAAIERMQNRAQAFTEPTEYGRKMAATMRELTKRRTPMQHWAHALKVCPDASIGYRYATEAMTILERKQGKIREPGEDEREVG